MMIYILLACTYAPAVSAADADYQYVNTYETKISSKTKTISKATGTHTKTLKHRSNKTYTASCTKTVKEIPITTYKNGIKTEKTYLTVFQYKYAYRKGSKQCRLSKTVLLKRKTEKYYYPKGYIKPRTQTGPKLPKKLANDFTKNGWKIVLDPGMDGYPYNYMGLCVYSDKQLIIRDYQSDTIYHEFGHYFAYTNGEIDTSKKFQSIFKKEKKKFKGSNPNSNTANSSEYFAECFKSYLLKEKWLKKRCPKTYQYIDKYYQQFIA